MNSLSWLIYLAEVVGRLGVTLGFVASVAGIFLFGACLSVAISEGETFDWVRTHFLKMVLAALIPTMLFNFLPSKQAVYMIAGSEMGQKVYENPGTQEILGDVKDIITKELKKLKEAK